uniref:protein-disulfide reductase n=1 Tax=Picea sitchensis TaxID=3332 RepID=B8LKG4_PICSI|nr:unknown [Picea sitchensis]ACN41140.1 unknown [Picea sitchensis]
MAELEQEKAVTHVGETHESLSSLLCNEERDFLIRNNGDKVKVEELEGKYVGLYFSAHWCPPCRSFTPVLSEIYKKLLEKGDFDIVFISADRDEKSFEEYHHTMPWLALPFSDENTRKNLNQAFQVHGIPCLVILDKEGRVITAKGVEIIKEYSAEAYPFTAERLDELRAKEEAIRAAQTVESLLLSDERDFVLGHEGTQVPVAELAGKTVGLYFSAHWCGPCRSFTPQLVEIYNELLKKGEAFEIVFLSRDKEEKAFEEYYASMPWLALPFADNTEKNLSRYFRVPGIPTLIILGPDGKTVQTDAVGLIRDYGIRAYPFTKERLDELEAEEEAKREAQTLESLLVSDERNFVINHGDAQVLVSELVGKTVALYFSAHWCPPCRSFTPELTKVYNELKERGETFEIVFISMDRNQDAFEDYYKSMPWLALPFGDKTKKDLSRFFRVRGIPSLIVVGPDGKTVTSNARSAVSTHGARAYPFTEAHFQRLQKEMKELVENSPKEIKYNQHEHPLVLTQRPVFVCDGCNKDGSAWSYYCKKCDYDLHLPCALKDQQDPGNQEKGQNTDNAVDENCKPAGVICDGDVCYKA